LGAAGWFCVCDASAVEGQRSSLTGFAGSRKLTSGIAVRARTHWRLVRMLRYVPGRIPKLAGR
jgi:hypothetical protein